MRVCVHGTHTNAAGSNYEILTCRIQQQHEEEQQQEEQTKTVTKVNSDKVTDVLSLHTYLHTFTHTHTYVHTSIHSLGRLKRIHCNWIHVCTAEGASQRCRTAADNKQAKQHQQQQERGRREEGKAAS